jgi:hypothetical protein
MLEPKKNVPLQVTKWVKIPMLLDTHEMEDLVLKQAPSFKLYDVQRVTPDKEGIYEPEEFLLHYTRYVNHLKKGEIPDLKDFRIAFSSAWSVAENAIYSIPSGESRRLLKACEPVVQSQMNQICFSKEEKTFRCQIFGNDSICWGIQLGFPFLFMDPSTYEAAKTRDFPNMALFLTIQRWARQNTSATPFIVNGVKMNSPIRLGKKCFSWIASHPQLIAQGITIDRA